MLNRKKLDMLNESSDIWISFDEQTEIRKNMPKLGAYSENDIVEHAYLAGKSLRASLSDDVINRLEEFSNNETIPYIVIRGLPIEDQLPSTPYDDHVKLSELWLSIGCQIGIYNLLNLHAVSYQNENKEKLIRHVVPSLNGRHEKSSHGSIYTFGMHADNPDLPLIPESIDTRCACPEFLSLYSLRCDNRVTTDILCIDDVVSRLPLGVIDSLEKPLFRVNQPDSFRDRKQGRVLPLLVLGENGLHYCRFDYENVSPISEEAAAALYMLRKVVTERELVSTNILLPGDVFIFRNQRTLHSRGGFVPKDNGVDRWLLRIFGVKNLGRHIHLKDRPRYVGKTI